MHNVIIWINSSSFLLANEIFRIMLLREILQIYNGFMVPEPVATIICMADLWPNA